MTSRELRAAFLEFYRHRGHTVIPSSSLVPDNDPSVLLTSAGMQQLKPYFLGERDPVKDFGGRKLASVQRCFRTSDIDEVGDQTHNTFFEMVGNFSIADYFREEAIASAWTFLTAELRLSTDRLWATIFAGDELTPRDTEAERLWQAYLPADRISAFGRAENFWGPPGRAGSCGPSSEIHVDLTAQACQRGSGCVPNCACGRFVELWNLVFTEFEKRADGSFVPLATKNIDTGMGLERLALVQQKAETIFETDLFVPIIESVVAIDAMSALKPDDRTRRQRIVADHLRAAVWLLADGVTFSNKDQGYILRRIVRRALDQLTVPKPDLLPILTSVASVYTSIDPSLKERLPSFHSALKTEQTAYDRVQRQELGTLIAKLRGQTGEAVDRNLTPEEAFTLYATHGTAVTRLEREGYHFDRVAFDQLLAHHQAKSRGSQEKKFGGHGLAHGVATEGMSNTDVQKITRLHTATHLLHAALRAVLGSAVQQNGSDINPERLRFDFSFPRKLTDAERHRVEELVNEKIRADLPVSWVVMPYEQAIAEGALAFFKEKYEPEVKVYTMGDFSKELCGGPHVEHTAQVGRFRLLSEKSIAAGMRRIKAVVEGA
ncbi:MAG: alanine--tRNA ligase [Candidatus Kerfeldbacteria bacterium]|nr:alanine--tRNA ligase [Candidatus Kerfeldbacteria bacterium]